MTDLPDLLPCPLCGGEADYFVPKFIQCINCGARSGYYDTCADARAAWNTRAAPRWIPVTERLPEFQDETKLDRSVLCTMEIKGKRHVTEIYFTHDNSFELVDMNLLHQIGQTETAA